MKKRVTRLGGLLAAYQRRDPAARSKLEIFLLYPGVHAIINHRIAHWLYLHHRFFLARCVSQWSRFWTGRTPISGRPRSPTTRPSPPSSSSPEKGPCWPGIRRSGSGSRCAR